jgi:hypothetical protein
MRRRTDADIEKKVYASEPTNRNWRHFGRADAKENLEV